MNRRKQRERSIRGMRFGSKRDGKAITKGKGAAMARHRGWEIRQRAYGASTAELSSLASALGVRL